MKCPYSKKDCIHIDTSGMSKTVECRDCRMMKLTISNQFIFFFHPVSESIILPENTTALVRCDWGYKIATWMDSAWYDEGSLIYAGGISGDITKDVIEFSIIENDGNTILPK